MKTSRKSLPARVKPPPGGAERAKIVREALWVEAMLQNGGNQTQAAVTAGYKPGAAAEQAGYRMSKSVRVAKVIAERRAALISKATLTTEGVLRELAGIVHSDLRSLMDPKTGALLPPSQWTEAAARAVAGVQVVKTKGANGEEQFEVKLKLWDKNAGIDKAMRHLRILEPDAPPPTPPTEPGEGDMRETARRMLFILAAGKKKSKEPA